MLKGISYIGYPRSPEVRTAVRNCVQGVSDYHSGSLRRLRRSISNGPDSWVDVSRNGRREREGERDTKSIG